MGRGCSFLFTISKSRTLGRGFRVCGILFSSSAKICDYIDPEVFLLRCKDYLFRFVFCPVGTPPHARGNKHMKLLETFIMSLTDEEALRLRRIKIGRKQSQILRHALSLRENKDTSSRLVVPTDYTPSHFYQIRSIILRRCYGEFGATTQEQLEFLWRKNHIAHFKQEFKRRESELSSKKSAEAEALYFTAFELLHRFPQNFIDMDLIGKCRKGYLAAKELVTPEDKLMLDARTAQDKLITLLNDGKEENHEPKKLFSKLSLFESKLTPSSDPRFSLNVFSAMAWYARYFGNDPIKFTHYCEAAIPFADRLRKNYIFREMPAAMRLRLGEAYFISGRDPEAKKVLQNTLAKIGPEDTLWKRYFFLFPSVEILMYQGKYDRCEEILKTHFEPLFTQRVSTAPMSGAALFAKLYLLKKEYPKAKKYLDLAINLNRKKNFTLRADLENRFLEAAYYYFIGDLDFAQTICKRARHFLVIRNKGLGKYRFGWYFRYLELVIKHIETGKAIPEEAEEKYKLLTARKEMVIGKLLQEIHPAI
jgi:tetratricopeptide (TPR) repeat protein